MYSERDYNDFNTYMEKKRHLFENEIKSTSQIQFDEMLDDQLFQTPEYRKQQMEQVFSELLKLQREIKLLIYKNTSEIERREFKKITLEMEIKKVMNACHIDPLEREMHLKKLDNDFIKDENESKIIINDIDMNLRKCKLRVKCCLRDIANLKDTFQREHNLIIDKMLNFKIKVSPATADIVQKKINFFDDCFKTQMLTIQQYETNITNPVYKIDDLSDIDESSSSSTCTCQKSSNTTSSVSFNEPDRDCDLKEDKDKEKDKDQEYIKQHLAKPLVQALSAITLYQPTDPIYFLANYLLHCRHNELMHAKKDMKFEMLMNERKELEKPKPKCVCVNCDNLVTANLAT